MISDNMKRYLNWQSVTIDNIVAPSRRAIEVDGLGPEGMRFERIGPDKMRRGDR